MYTTADGLVQATVFCVYQDTRGCMWFGTAGGVSRYDSKRFLSYSNNAIKVLCMGEDPAGTLWIGTTAGVATMSPGDTGVQWLTSPRVPAPSSTIRTIRRDRDDNMWVGTDDGLVVVPPQGHPLLFNEQNGLQDDHIQEISEDVEGRILIATFGGVMRCHLVDGALADREVLLSEPVSSMIICHDGSIVAASLKRFEVLRYHDGIWDLLFDVKSMGAGIHASRLGEDAGGRIWIGTSQGLVIIQGRVPQRIGKKEGLRSVFITGFARDAEDNMWVGTEDGVAKLPNSPFRNFDLASGLPGDHVIALFTDSGGNVWFGTYQGAVRISGTGTVLQYGTGQGLPHLSVHDFAEEADGDVWIGTYGGLMVSRDGTLRGPAVAALRSTRIIRLLHDPDGSLWCGSAKSVLRWSHGVLDTVIGQGTIDHANVSALFRDSTGTLWYGTDNEGGGFLHDGVVTRLTATEGLPNPWVTSITQDRHSTIWFTTQAGAVLWNGRSFVPVPTREEQLLHGVVMFAVRDSTGSLWLGTEQGVFQWDDSVVAHWDERDGLIADVTRRGYVDAAGNVWVGTVGGASKIDRDNLRRLHAPPAVYVEGVEPDDSAGVMSTRDHFAYDENTFIIHYNALSFLDERRTEFQWTLSGFDAGWLPPRSDRQVRYTHLPWGRFEFLVRARNRRSSWSAPARFAFVITPPLWAQWWFVSAGALMVIAAGAALYRRRVGALQREHRVQQQFSRQLMESQENERKRIAAELHDSLVQNLLIARNRSLIGLRHTDEPARVERELSEISGVLGSAIDEVRDIAHNLRPYQLDRMGLSKALRSLVAKLGESVPFRLTAAIDDLDPLLNDAASIHVYRICQEGLNNILKHASATVAGVSMRAGDNRIELVLMDDGKGMPPAGQRRDGSGLSGIAHRVALLGGSFDIVSSPGKGTTLTIRIPATRNDA